MHVLTQCVSSVFLSEINGLYMDLLIIKMVRLAQFAPSIMFPLAPSTYLHSLLSSGGQLTVLCGLESSYPVKDALRVAKITSFAFNSTYPHFLHGMEGENSILSA